MKIASLTDSKTRKGLKLAGVKESYKAENKEKAEKIFEDLTKNDEIGLIIITEDIAQKIDDKLEKFREEREGTIPALIEIPGEEGSVPERRRILDKLVKRAVGINIER
ncbi:MAG: V-type ATP synthase subunit F [Candidatus Hadarchaeia archaeon]